MVTTIASDAAKRAAAAAEAARRAAAEAARKIAEAQAAARQAAEQARRQSEQTRQPPTADPSRSGGASGTSGPASTSGPTGTSGTAPAGAFDDPRTGTLRQNIENLDGKGDSAYFRLGLDGSLSANLRLGQVGLGAGQSSDIRVTRNGDGPDATYTVRYDKGSQASINAGTGTDTLGKAKGKGAGGAVPATPDGDKSKSDFGLNASAELNGRVTDAVEMTFSSKEEAIRAAETLQKMQIADGVSALAKTSPISQLPGIDKLVGGPNPLGNPLTSDGSTGWLGNKIAGLQQEDVDFLKSHVTAYEQSIGGSLGVGGDVTAKSALARLNIAAEGKFENGARAIRRVELPQNGGDGSVTYSLEGSTKVTGKQKEGIDLGAVGLKLDNRQDVGNATTKLSVTYDLPASSFGANPTASGRPIPELDALRGGAPLKLRNATLESTIEARAQGLSDPSRTDTIQIKSKYNLENPESLGTAFDQVQNGDFRGAARTAGVGAQFDINRVNRGGYDVNPGVSLDFVVGKAGLTGTVTNGIDDVTNLRTTQIGTPAEVRPVGDPNQPIERQRPPRTQPEPGPVDDGQTYAVTPYEGVQVRQSPGGGSNGVAQSGTFVRADGETTTDGAGNTWMRVTTTDVNDRPVEGWVRQDHLAPHSSATGAMDETGRINPSAEHQRYDQVTVQPGDNLWDLAQRNGWDFNETVALNQQHLQNPSLIFPGDTVYVPGTARGPNEVPVKEPIPRGRTDDTGSTGSGGPSGSGPSGSGPSGSGPSGSGPKPTKPSGGPSGSGPGGSGPAQPAPGGSGSGSGPGETDRQPGPQGRRRPIDRQRELDDIRREYQVEADDQTTNWQPSLDNGLTEGAGRLFADAFDKITGDKWNLSDKHKELLEQARLEGIPQAEADMLDKLDPAQQAEFLLLSKDMMDSTLNAFERPPGYTGDDATWRNDGHVDAYRHALWNAKMTQKFGAEWTEQYATAHEMIGGNPATREAMDLHNNEVGRQIAIDNPNASDAELEQLVKDAVLNGDTVVVDGGGQLAFSDDVAIGAHGQVSADEAEAPGNPDIQVDPDSVS